VDGALSYNLRPGPSHGDTNVELETLGMPKALLEQPVALLRTSPVGRGPSM
jgi:hypothetical protein